MVLIYYGSCNSVCFVLAIRTREQKWGGDLKVAITRVLGILGGIGLLLNAPYKIDSMVWMRLWIMLYL
jgi:hypothetical protein